MSVIFLKGSEGDYQFNPNDTEAHIGPGGQANLFKGSRMLKNDSTKNKVIPIVVKVKHAQLDERNQVKRFMTEGSIRISHPNLLEIHDYVETKNINGEKKYHIITEYISGVSLANLIDRGQSLFVRNRVVDKRLACLIVEEIAMGLSKLHNEEIIHRDIKPSNIMLMNASVDAGNSSMIKARKTAHSQLKNYGFGGLKIIDFGIVSDRRFGDMTENLKGFLGSIEYAAPEQIDYEHPEKINNATDIYALGILLYELLTGQVPFNRNDEQIRIKKNNVLKPHANLNTKEYEFILNATKPNQQQRIQTAQEFLTGLKKLKERSIFDGLIQWFKKKFELRSGFQKFKIAAPIFAKHRIAVLITSIIIILGGLVIYLHRQGVEEEKYQHLVSQSEKEAAEGLYVNAINSLTEALMIHKSPVLEERRQGLLFLTDGLNAYHHARFSEAYDKFKNADMHGNSAAAYYLGELTFNGLGTPKSDSIGELYTKKAYDNGFSMAGFRLGILHDTLTGRYRSQNVANNYFQKAFEQIKLLAGNGDAKAMVNLCDSYYLYYDRIGIARDSLGAWSILYNAIHKTQSVVASNHLAWYNYLYVKNMDSAIHYAAIGAEKGDPFSQFTLSKSLIDISHADDAQLWLNKSVSQNFPLSLLFKAKDEHKKGSFDSAFYFFDLTRQFDIDNTEALSYLYHYSLNGLAGSKDTLAALNYLGEIVDIDSSIIEASIYSAEIYLLGATNVIKDTTVAVGYLRNAVNNWKRKYPGDQYAINAGDGFDQYENNCKVALHNFVRASKSERYPGIGYYMYSIISRKNCNQ